MTYREMVTYLQTNYLGSHWTLRGDTYESLEWLDDPSTKPTPQEFGF